MSMHHPCLWFDLKFKLKKIYHIRWIVFGDLLQIINKIKDKHFASGTLVKKGWEPLAYSIKINVKVYV